MYCTMPKQGQLARHTGTIKGFGPCWVWGSDGAKVYRGTFVVGLGGEVGAEQRRKGTLHSLGTSATSAVLCKQGKRLWSAYQ